MNREIWHKYSDCSRNETKKAFFFVANGVNEHATSNVADASSCASDVLFTSTELLLIWRLDELRFATAMGRERRQLEPCPSQLKASATSERVHLNEPRHHQRRFGQQLLMPPPRFGYRLRLQLCNWTVAS